MLHWLIALEKVIAQTFDAFPLFLFDLRKRAASLLDAVEFEELRPLTGSSLLSEA